MRILGVDFGTKFTGLAMSDESRIIASSLGDVTGYHTINELSKCIQKKIEGYTFSAVMIGNPINMSGRESQFSDDIRALGESLQQEMKLPVVYWDERLSTRAVERSMIEGDLSRKKRKKKINSISAQWTLQGYLDYLHESGKEE